MSSARHAHCFLVVWRWRQDSKRAASILTDSKNIIFVSAATAWELAIKANVGKIDALELVTDLTALDEGFVELAMSIEHATGRAISSASPRSL